MHQNKCGRISVLLNPIARNIVVKRSGISVTDANLEAASKLFCNVNIVALIYTAGQKQAAEHQRPNEKENKSGQPQLVVSASLVHQERGNR